MDARRPPKLVLRTHLPDPRAQFVLDWRTPSPRVRFPTPIAPKACPMPPNQRFRLDNRNDRQDRWKPSIHLDEEPAVVVGRLSATPHPAPQDDQLMSEHRILRLKPALRLERRGQHGQNKTEQPDHSASLGDSIRSSTQIRLRYTQVFAAASLKRWASASRSSKVFSCLTLFHHQQRSLGARGLRVSCSRRTNHRQPAGAPCHGAGRNTFAEHHAPSIVTCLRHCSVGLPRWNGS